MTLSHVTCRANCKYVVTCGKPPPNLLGAYSVAPHVTRLCQGGPLSAVRACARSNGTRCRSRDCLFITPSALPHLLPTNYRTLESPSPPVAKSKFWTRIRRYLLSQRGPAARRSALTPIWTEYRSVRIPINDIYMDRYQYRSEMPR
jgi:hypothetical protein